MPSVLLVEDDESLRKCLYQTLLKDGWVVYQATSATALVVLEQFDARLDVLITDVAMSLLDGFELAQHVLQKFPNTPIIFMSGSGLDRDVMARTPESARVSVFLGKPFSPSLFESIVANLATLRFTKRDP